MLIQMLCYERAYDCVNDGSYSTVLSGQMPLKSFLLINTKISLEWTVPQSIQSVQINS